MKGEHLKLILNRYWHYLEHEWPELSPRQLEAPDTQDKSSRLEPGQRVAHYKFMCLEAQRFVDQGRIEKAMRWLGFLQGVLWKNDEYSLDELKEHSKPKESI